MSSGYVLSKPELRHVKPERQGFLDRPRSPIHLLLDGVQGSYNLGAIIRLCDAMRLEHLTVCGVNLELHKRKLIQAAQGAQKWVPMSNPSSVLETVGGLKQQGYRIVVAEITSVSVRPERYTAGFPLCLVVGNERTGVSQPVVDLADAAIAVPMHGMCNSLNVSTAAAIVLYQLSLQLREDTF